MKSVVSSAFLTLSILVCTFLLVFSFHAQTPLHEDVKEYLETGEGELPFSSEANSHMHDVFVLFSLLRVVSAGLVVGTLWILSYIQKKDLQRISGVLIGLPIVIGLLPWNTVFSVFHQVFFPQGNWIFPAQSLLIQTYPASFFIGFASVWATILIATGIAGFIVSQKLLA
jgi:integral membrane protein (TIGR01906 family)